MEQTISILLFILGCYLMLGVFFSIVFLWKGISKIDIGTKDSGFFLKFLLFPGLVFFWVTFLNKWLKNKS